MMRAIAPRRRGQWRAAVAATILFAAEGGTAMAAPIQIYAAGSLRAAMQALIAGSGAPAETFAEPVFGASGTLRERLAKGEQADLFASADMAQPMRLASANPHLLVVPFAGNRLCVLSKAAMGLTAANLLDRMLSPEVRLATSTPVVDPAGDYAMAAFDKAEAARPGAGAALRAKAMHLLGAPGKMAPVPGFNPTAAIFRDDQADALIYYCSGAPAVMKEVEGLASLPMPEPLDVRPVYGMAILSQSPEAGRFALFVASTKGQDVLARFGFLPPAGTK